MVLLPESREAWKGQENLGVWLVQVGVPAYQAGREADSENCLSFGSLWWSAVRKDTQLRYQRQEAKDKSTPTWVD